MYTCCFFVVVLFVFVFQHGLFVRVRRHLRRNGRCIRATRWRTVATLQRTPVLYPAVHGVFPGAPALSLHRLLGHPQAASEMLVRLLQRGASGGARIPHCAFASTSPPLLAPYKKPPSSTDAAFSLDSLLDESGPDAPVKKGSRRPARGPPGRPLPRPLPAAVTRPPPRRHPLPRRLPPRGRGSVGRR